AVGGWLGCSLEARPTKWCVAHPCRSWSIVLGRGESGRLNDDGPTAVRDLYPGAEELMLQTSAVVASRPKAPATPAALAKPKPPLAPAVRTALCAGFALTGWLVGGSFLAVPAFVAAYVAGGTGPMLSMVAALRQRRLGVDLLMLLAA